MIDTKILIMCGGRGKRLGKMTENIPKPLIKINQQTILENKIQEYQKQGFNNFIFCIGYKGEMIRRLVKNNYQVKAEYSDAGLEAGILARLSKAKTLYGDQVLMTYGDTFTDIQLQDLINSHNETENEATIVVSPIQNPFGLVEFNNENQVTYFKEKPILNYYIGYAMINKSALDLVPKSVIHMPNGEGLVEFYKTLKDMGLLGCYFHSGLETTFNTKEELKTAKYKMKRFYTAFDENAHN